MRKVIILLFITLLLSGCETEKDRFINHLVNDYHFRCTDNNCIIEDEHESSGNGAKVHTTVTEEILLEDNNYSRTYDYLVTKTKNKKTTKSENSWSITYNYNTRDCDGARITSSATYDYDEKTEIVSIKKDKYNCKKTKDKTIKELCEEFKDKCLEMKNNFVRISKGYDLEEIINSFK